ncbi:polyamine aminopropyltransferase [Flavobacteriaceae bacterium]|nr:polyamine aminopropyltransferase [Flavobacteriaceae bacterium]
MENNKAQTTTLIFSAFIAGLCSIIYELLIATTTSYFLGDSVKYFSLTIGIYMASMGFGSFISKYIEGNILKKFIQIEIALGILGGISIPALYFSYAFTPYFLLFYFFFTTIIGFLIGLEIPFLARLMEQYHKLKTNIANILSFDYLGALIATVTFPLLLLPLFGTYQTSLIIGLINMSIGCVILWKFKDNLKNTVKKLRILFFLATLFLILMIIFSSFILKIWDNNLYEDRIIHSSQSKYQKIVLTKDRDDVRLFLNGNLQFSSLDEYRYHESLIHVPIAVSNHKVKNVLLLGAGDGLAIRELLKYPEIENITLVDLDEALIELAKKNQHFRKLNYNSLQSKKLKIIIGDAFSYLVKNQQPFDFIIGDLPDPNNIALARLYSKQFYRLIKKNLIPGGFFVTQATSPYFATKAFWSINQTIKAAGFSRTMPYHAQIPSFGDWGFILATTGKIRNIKNLKIEAHTKFIDSNNLAKLFIFDKDMAPKKEVKINMLDSPILLQYYLDGWRRYNY